MVFGEVLHINSAEVAQTGMKGDFGEVDAFEFHTFQQVSAEMETGCGGGNSTFHLGINGLLVFFILWNNLTQSLQVFRQWGQSQFGQFLLEGVVIVVKQKTQGAAS